MTKNPLVYCLIAACFFGTWPVIARFAHLSPGWLALVFSIGTGVVAVAGLNSPVPLARPLIIGVGAGMVNGIGMLAFAKLISWEGVQVSRVIPITFALMPVFTTLAALVLFGEQLSLRKAFGVTLAFIAVYLLSSY